MLRDTQVRVFERNKWVIKHLHQVDAGAVCLGRDGWDIMGQ